MKPATSDETVKVDGDQVIAFIGAVEKLGEILHALNVIEVKDAFIYGKRCKAVDEVIDISKSWQHLAKEVGDEFHASVTRINALRSQLNSQIAFMKTLTEAMKSEESKTTLNKINEFADACERIQKLKQDGTLDLILNLK